MVPPGVEILYAVYILDATNNLQFGQPAVDFGGGYPLGQKWYTYYADPINFFDWFPDKGDSIFILNGTE